MRPNRRDWRRFRCRWASQKTDQVVQVEEFAAAHLGTPAVLYMTPILCAFALAMSWSKRDQLNWPEAGSRLGQVVPGILP